MRSLNASGVRTRSARLPPNCGLGIVNIFVNIYLTDEASH
jgi:hypothetical protein